MISTRRLEVILEYLSLLHKGNGTGTVEIGVGVGGAFRVCGSRLFLFLFTLVRLFTNCFVCFICHDFLHKSTMQLAFFFIVILLNVLYLLHMLFIGAHIQQNLIPRCKHFKIHRSFLESWATVNIHFYDVVQSVRQGPNTFHLIIQQRARRFFSCWKMRL